MTANFKTVRINRVGLVLVTLPPNIAFTLVYSPDQESYISDGGVLRSITGGDSISFRPLYKGAFKDTVKAIFLITGNSPIIFKEQKGGTSRRRVIFQFNKVVSESEKDYHLKDKLEQEAGGIVRLLLDTFPDAMTAKQLLEEQKGSEEALEVKEEFVISVDNLRQAVMKVINFL